MIVRRDWKLKKWQQKMTIASIWQCKLETFAITRDYKNCNWSYNSFNCTVV